MTSSSPKMLPKSRSDSDMTRARCLMGSMMSMSGASDHGRPGRHGEVLQVRHDALRADAFDVVEAPTP